MAQAAHCALLEKGVQHWNRWRQRHPDEHPDLSGANLAKATLTGADLHQTTLSHANLSGAVLSGANLSDADLSKANLHSAFLSGANLSRVDLTSANLTEAYLAWANLTRANLVCAQLAEAHLDEADLTEANLHGANLTRAHFAKANMHGANLFEADCFRADMIGVDVSEADLTRANLTWADFTGADFTGARLVQANLVRTDLTGATLIGCRIFGMSAWGVKLYGAEQADLIITSNTEATIAVDDLEVAQLMHLLLNNQQLGNILHTVSSRVVLVLGQFSSDNKPILQAMREHLRATGRYIPVLFDFARLPNPRFTDTVRTLAQLSRFAIVCITDRDHALQEWQAITPILSMLPVQPVLHSPQYAYSVFDDLQDHRTALPLYRYSSRHSLMASFEERILRPLEERSSRMLIERFDHQLPLRNIITE